MNAINAEQPVYEGICPLVKAETVYDGKAPTEGRALDPQWDDDKVGPKARVFTDRIMSSCAGWPKWPTSEELYEALHAEQLDRRQQAMVSMWVNEASEVEIMDGWIQEAYTLRELVEAMHRTGNVWNSRRNQWIRTWFSEAPPWNG